MKLNCKPGDLAVIVMSESGFEGIVVTCLEFIGIKKWDLLSGGVLYLPTWRTDHKFPKREQEDQYQCTDQQLRPIRNDPGADETLSWADVPSEVTA